MSNRGRLNALRTLNKYKISHAWGGADQTYRIRAADHDTNLVTIPKPDNIGYSDWHDFWRAVERLCEIPAPR